MPGPNPWERIFATRINRRTAIAVGGLTVTTPVVAACDRAQQVVDAGKRAGVVFSEGLSEPIPTAASTVTAVTLNRPSGQSTQAGDPNLRKAAAAIPIDVPRTQPKETSRSPQEQMVLKEFQNLLTIRQDTKGTKLMSASDGFKIEDGMQIDSYMWICNQPGVYSGGITRGHLRVNTSTMEIVTQTAPVTPTDRGNKIEERIRATVKFSEQHRMIKPNYVNIPLRDQHWNTEMIDLFRAIPEPSQSFTPWRDAEYAFPLVKKAGQWQHDAGSEPSIAYPFRQYNVAFAECNERSNCGQVIMG